MKRLTLSILAGAIALTTLGMALPANADLFDGMPTGSIMGTYQDLMGMTPYGNGGGFWPDVWGGSCMPDTFGGSLMDGMPTRTFGDDYQYYYNGLMDLWAATGYGSLAGLGAMNGSFENAGEATRFWGGRWADEGILEKEPTYLDLPGHYVEYGW